MPLSVGKIAPDFTALDQDGKTIHLSDFRGKKVALYFYPQDDTPTCTKEACNLRDNYQSLLAKGIQVVGVSPDTVKSHRKFTTKYELPFPLVADVDQKIVNAYGVWGEKTLFGRTYMGTHRVTFMIGEDGTIEKVIDQVKSDQHAEQLT